MTTQVSQHQIPPQASSSTSASQSTLSYASTAKKAVSSPPIATGSSTPSPAVAVGGSAPVQQHGKSHSISPANGRASVPPAVPVVSAPAIAHSSAANGGSEHSRKNSVTISANGPSGYIPNGGPVGGQKAGIPQFGSIADSPAASHSTPHVSQSNASAPIPIPGNPRVVSPAQSPSPIPQPSASGGRPPSSLAPSNNGTINFGSLDGDRHNRQASVPQGPMAPGNQAAHIRRESNHSAQSDQAPGRGGFNQQAGRGRGSFNQGQFPQQQPGYPPTGGMPFRANSGRGGMAGGMAPPFQNPGRPMGNPAYQGSPNLATRSPAMPNSMPGTPNMNQAMPMQNQPQQFNGYYAPQPNHYGGYPQQGYNDRMQYPMNGGPPMMYGQMQNMGYNIGPPQSPQPGYQQPYVTGQYGQAQPMSRNSSQMSEHRPASSTGMGQPGTPSMAPAVAHSNTPHQKPSPAPNSSFSRPARKSAAIVIKRPDGEAIDVEKLKAPASPAPKDRARTPPVIASTPTPPPKSATPQHTRVDSIVQKSTQQIQQEILEKVKAAAAADNEKVESQAKADAETKAANEAKAKEEEKAKLEAKAAEDAKIKEAEEKAAAEKKAKEEEEELERQIEEMERAEAEREKKEAELLEKRAAEKAIADKANAEKAKALAEENDRKLKEQEREMERLEDEKEAKRLAAAQGGAKPEDSAVKPEAKEAAPTTPSTLASKLSSLTLGTDSGASTPGSDDSMGPPPKVANEKRSKPAALNLAPLNTKPIEPPQPSAALQSLKSARFLTVLNSAIYPADIRSPNPALNTAVTTKGKSFKYDKEFLLQFQKVFVEKPSMEFESQIKALIGDPTEPGSARSAHPRGGSGLGPRGSNRPAAPFSMGQFASGGSVGGKTLPPGTTSAERFAASSASMSSRPAPHPMASFSRAPGSFAGGPSMSRNGSQMGNNAPNSPRQGSRSQRQGSKRDPYQSGGNSKQDAQHAKNMPLTANQELKPIQVTATGWKPRSIPSQSATGAAGPAPGASGTPGHMEPEMVQRKVKAALNKMTPEKFDKISEQVLVIAQQSKDEADGRTLRQVIQLTFEKATDEAHWASMYAKFCKRMLETMSPDIKDESILDKNGNIVSGGNLFRKYLLNRCQEEFERGWKMDLGDKPEGERGEEKTEEAAMLSDEYYIAAAAKRRGLGLVQFIGELYKLSMLTERIMHECVKKLVDYTGIPDEAEIESLTKLLKTIGFNLDSTEKGKPMMDVYFSRIQGMVDTPDLPSRLRFMLMDIIDLRRNHWKSKEANKGPKTLDEVRLEAEAAAAQKAAENARGPRGGGGGGGGRMQMGRGDSRNFSNQYGNQPPPDYNKNTVGMDDLRRLGAKGANRNASQQMSFGPTSMFSSRSNSGRKMGPGGSLSRTGDDSGPSSRTGTPPQQKEKESATSANAFSLLANMGEPEHPASPPSTANSPELSKATPANAGKSEDKKEGES